jgi:hypothetical protein
MKGCSVVALAGLAWATYSSGRIALSDYLYSLDTPESLRSAIALEPGNADFHSLLAEHLEGANLDPKPELFSAISLSPDTSRYLVRAALREEVDKNFPEAERLLVKAVKSDLKFGPRWALLNFYFRRGAEQGVWPAGFWPAFTESLEICSPEDAPAVFKLAWERTDNSAEILRHVPTTPIVQRSYLTYLIESEHTEAGAEVAKRLVSNASADDKTLLLAFAERSRKREMAASVAVWNGLIAKNLVSANPLNPSGGAILTNKTFQIPTLARGFDWRIPSIEGILVSQSASPAGLTLSFDGEPEDCVILTQPIPVLWGRQYEIDYTYKADETPFAGLRWELSGASGNLAASDDLSGTGERTGRISFTADADFAELALHYHRPMGAVRAQGSISIYGLADRILK